MSVSPLGVVLAHTFWSDFQKTASSVSVDEGKLRRLEGLLSGQQATSGTIKQDLAEQVKGMHLRPDSDIISALMNLQELVKRKLPDPPPVPKVYSRAVAAGLGAAAVSGALGGALLAQRAHRAHNK